MKSLTFAFASSFVAFALAACSVEATPIPTPATQTPDRTAEQDDPPASSASTNEEAEEEEETPTTDGQCHATEQVAKTAMFYFESKAEPTAKGGELDDGTYVLERVTRYGVQAPDEPREYSDRMTMRYVKGVAEFVVNEGELAVKRSRSTVTINGSSLNAKDTCPPSTKTNVIRFTATGDALDLYVTRAGLKLVQHFVRVGDP